MSLFHVVESMRSQRGADARMDDEANLAASDPVLGPVVAGVRALACTAAPEPQGDLLVLLTEGFTPPATAAPASSPVQSSASSVRRWFSRVAVVAAPVTLKIAAATTVAAAATVGGLAVTGSLPDGMQRWISDVAAAVNIELPRPESALPTSARNAAVPPAETSTTGRAAADDARQGPADRGLVPPESAGDDPREGTADDRRDAEEDAADDRRDAEEDAADDRRDAEEDAADDRRDADEDAADDRRDADEDAADDREDAQDDAVDDREDVQDDAVDDREDAQDDAEDAADEAQEDAAGAAEDAADDARDAEQAEKNREAAQDAAEDAADD